MCLTENLLMWIYKFLFHCKQHTRVGDALLKSAGMIRGIIQGSFLGPLLFVICDLFDNDVTCKLYADYVKLYTVIH